MGGEECILNCENREQKPGNTGKSMKKFWFSAYSPSREGALYIRSCGHCCVGKEHRELFRLVDYYNFYWCVAGSASFKQGEKYQKLNPGDVWHMVPGTPHDFFPGEEGFHYYWLAFQGTGCSFFSEVLKLVPGRKYCGEPPSELFQKILDGLGDLTPERRIEILGIALQIVFKIAAAPGGPGAVRQKLALKAKDILEKEFADPALNIDEVARLLAVHRVTLCREFKKEFRMTPSAYLRGCRIRKAMELLTSNRYSIKEIAYACGFSSPEYFSTVFTAEFGRPPSRL